MQTPLISIIIPVYKVETYIRDCIDSILSQSYENLEIILIDDGSPDKCPLICDEYAKKDKRIIVFHQKNQGLSGARNSGIRLAKGEYFCFVDSDDVLHPDYIQKLFDAICYTNYKISICNNVSFSNSVPETKTEPSDFRPVDLLDIFKIQNSMCAWGKLFHKSLFENIEFPVGKIHEDEFIIYIILYNAHNIAYCSSSLYFYRIREGSIMQHREEVFYTDFLEALLKNYNFFYSHNEVNICEQFLLRLTYLNSDYNNYCKSNHCSPDKTKSISKIIYRLPKKKLPCKLRIKVFLKTSLVFLFGLH